MKQRTMEMIKMPKSRLKIEGLQLSDIESLQATRTRVSVDTINGVKAPRFIREVMTPNIRQTSSLQTDKVEYDSHVKWAVSKAITIQIESWLGYQHDPQRTGRTTANNVIIVGDGSGYVYMLRPDKSEVWVVQLEDSIRTQPIIGDDGTIYIGDSTNTLYALNPKDGSVKWSISLSSEPTAPAIGDDGTVYVAGRGDGVVYALNPKDGSVKWTFNTGSSLTTTGEICLANDRLYVGTYREGTYAISLSGTQIWNSSVNTQNPVAVGHNGAVYVTAVGWIKALDPNDGSVIWYNDYGDASGAPSVGSDGTIYLSIKSYYYYLYAINPADGSEKWNVLAGGTWWTPPAIGDDGTIYVTNGSGGYIKAYLPDGTLKWKYDLGAATSSPPVIAGDGTIYVGVRTSNPGMLYAFNPDGSLKWKYYTNDEIVFPPAIG